MVASAPEATGVLARMTQYAEGVVSGEIVAGQLVRLACERHLRDLELGSLRGLRFDEDAAAHAIAFIELLKHSKGRWAGANLVLADWQVFIVGSVFGWMRGDGTRRFREAYTEVARKNGKTTLLAAIGLYLAFADGEPGAEVYSAATKRDQAKLCWSEADRMVQSTPALARLIQRKPSVSNLSNLQTFSKFEPLGRDSDTADGLNPHAAIIDELHAHPNRGMVDVLRTALGARLQPILWAITTAGSDQESVWWQMRTYAVNVLMGTSEDDALFAYVATPDQGDDWRDETIWAKGNPNLGVSVRIEELREQARRAEAMPSEQNAFRRLRLNEPTEQSERWIDMATWDRNADAPQVEPGMQVFAALDLSSTIDITACVAVVPRDGGYDVLPRFWRPGDTIVEAEQRDGVPYRQWADAGYLTLTDGTAIDPVQIADDIADWLAPYTVPELAFDAWNAAGAAARLESLGVTVVSMAQGFATYSEPCHALEGLLLEGAIRHGGHPILRWMASQVMVKFGPNNAIRPYKPHGSGIRDDGIVALLMALSRARVHQQAAPASEPSIVVIDLDDEPIYVRRNVVDIP